MVSQTICNVLKCLLVVVVVASLIGNCVLIWLNTQRTQKCPAQQVNPAQPAIHDERSNVFADLSVEEYLQVRDYMSKIPGMNISIEPALPPSVDYLYMIDLSLPKKQDVLHYLDANGPKPAREATAVVFHGTMNNVKEYVVGPLPNPSYHHDVTFERYKKEIPLTARPLHFGEHIGITMFLRIVLKPLSKLLDESFGIDGSTFQYSMPEGVKSGDRETWLSFSRNEEGFFIHHVGFEILINHQSTNFLSWHVIKVLYNGQYFDSIMELKHQYEAGTVSKVIYKPVPNYASLKPKKKPTGVGPQQFYVHGKRFSVKNNHIVYLDWSFVFGLNPLTGMRVFDVRFRGGRIIYELSVQEAMSVYGSVTPNLMLTKFLDGSMGIGRCAYELVRGVDCPYSATYIDTFHFLDTGVPRQLKNSICVFEHDMGQPLRRHFSEIVFNSYGGLANSALVFRTITAIGNYDYMWDFIFYQSGSVEAKVHATGYIASSFTLNNSFPFGHQVAENVTGNVHTHFISFKVDVDVLGVKNVFQTKDMEFVNVSLPWMPERHAMIPKVVEKQLQTEQQAALCHDTKTPRYLHIASSKTNRWGHQRSYRLQVFSFTGDHLPESQPEERAMSWARYKVAITRQKDLERCVGSLYNQHDMWSPAVDFSKYIEDNESIENQDLVAWVTTGFLHIPHTEDIPNTVTVGNGGGVLLRPHNYFDEDPSIHSADAVYIDPGSEASCDNNRMACLTKETCSPVLEPFTYNGFDKGFITQSVPSSCGEVPSHSSSGSQANCPLYPDDYIPPPPLPVISTMCFTADHVRRQLTRLHSSKAADPDGVSPMVLKACAPSYVEYFTTSST
uniref:membrane primary amine oxidase-like n=1 Tax=Epinephelus lanceolatus TaxID=310571 RepID=UPI001447A347|nr:membrane primary amine oxidase-like [Epinephelus lanceolatus]